MSNLTANMNRRDARVALLGVLLSLALGGCVVSETRPQPKVHPVQASIEIPEGELLDVGVRLFDPGIPPEVESDTELQQKKGIYPDVRRAEARYMAMLLRNTLESSAQWGAVRVIPATAEFVDVDRDRPDRQVDGQGDGNPGDRARLDRPHLVQGREIPIRSRHRLLPERRCAQGARSVPERLFDDRQRHAGVSQDAHRGRPPPGARGDGAALCAGSRADRVFRICRAECGRPLRGSSACRPRATRSTTRHPYPCARRRPDRHGERLLRQFLGSGQGTLR